MPTNAGTIGAMALPSPAETIDTALADPVVMGLLDYLAHWLNWGLNAKLVVQIGTSAEAVPALNRFPFDPGRVFVRRALPALYVWCPDAGILTEWTTMRRMRTRTIKVQWVFDELASPQGVELRHGLLVAADNLLALAESQDEHQTWPVSGFPDIAPGESFGRAFGLRKWVKQAAQFGAMWGVPSPSSLPGGPGDGAAQYGYPTLQTSFLIEELIDRENYTADDIITTTADTILGGDHLDDLQGGGGYGLEVETYSFIATEPEAIAEAPIGA